jgi:predicted RNA-binding Zn-ribbon protein involved in translation (DUF1610 family)
VPWCDACDRFLSPSTVKVDGTCPSCGRVVDAGRAHTAETSSSQSQVEDDDETLPPIPWHLWLLAAALAVYLGYRAMQGIEWLFGH